MAITGDDQFEWRSFKIGDGTSYAVARVSGLGKASLRRSPLGRVGQHGAILPRADLLGERVITMEVEVEGSTRADLLAKLDALDTATAPASTGDEVLQFQILGVTRQVNCRPAPADWEWDVGGDIGLLVQSVDLEFFCQDPRVYSGGTTVTVLA